MIRRIIVDGMSYREAAVAYNVDSINSIYSRMARFKTQYPEFIEMLEQQQVEVRIDRGLPQREELLPVEEQTRNLKNFVRAVQAIGPDATPVQKELAIANRIEEVISTLIDIPASDLRCMKPEHRLRYISDLVKTTRLLREESTENVKKLSIIKAVGIATSRRKPAD